MKKGAGRVFRRFALGLLALFLLLSVGVAIYLKVTAAERADARRVQELLAKLDDNYLSEANPSFDELMAMRERAYPELRRILRWRESGATRTYERLWIKSPGFIRKHLPLPGARSTLQVKATGVVFEMGPVACRGVAGAMADYLMHTNVSSGTAFPLRILYWSIPESPKCTMALSNWLTRWESENQIFGWTYSYDLWPRVPQLAPLVVDWLKNPDVADEAAAILGTLGTNANFALPALLEVADKGVVGTNTNLVVRYLSSKNKLTGNRMAALGAIGKIGRTNGNTRAVLDRALVYESEVLRLQALVAKGEMGLDIEAEVKTVLEKFPLAKSLRAKQCLIQIGKLGPRSKAAIPWLKRLTEMEFVRKLPDSKTLGTPPAPPEEIRAAAIMAICKIDPGQFAEWMPVLATNHFLKQNWETVTFLMEQDSHQEEITKALEPFLSHPTVIEQMKAAMVILKQQPNHRAAREILESQLKSSDPEMQLTAAVYLARARVDFSVMMPVLRKGLLMSGDHPQTALNAVELMGDEAKALVPELKQCLYSQSSGARDWAGRILRRVAPEEMPPICEE